jgi:Fic family protein
MNLLLVRSGYPPALLSVEERARYYDALEAANNGKFEPFEFYIAEATRASLARVLEVVG